MAFLKLHIRSSGAEILINSDYIVSVYKGREGDKAKGTDICVVTPGGDGAGQFGGEEYHIEESFADVSQMV